MPENNQTPQTVDLSSVNPPQNSAPQEGFFDRQLKNFAWFLAKVTWQPDPQTWSQNPAPQSTPQESITQQPSEPALKESSFFDKLVANTQGLLNKTQELATSIADKTSTFSEGLVKTTQNVTSTVQNVSNSVISTTTNAAQTIASAPQNIANTVGSIAEQTTNQVQNLGNQATSTAQNFANQATQGVSNLVQTGQEIWSQIVDHGSQAVSNIQTSATQAATTIQNQTSNFMQNPVETLQSSAENLTNQAQNIAQQSVNIAQQTATQTQQTIEQGSQTGLLNQISSGVIQIVDKSKEIWSSAIENTKSFVENPVEKVDSLISAGMPQTPVQTETENTTSLDNLDKKLEKSESAQIDPTPGIYQ